MTFLLGLLSALARFDQSCLRLRSGAGSWKNEPSPKTTSIYGWAWGPSGLAYCASFMDTLGDIPCVRRQVVR